MISVTSIHPIAFVFHYLPIENGRLTFYFLDFITHLTRFERNFNRYFDQCMGNMISKRSQCTWYFLWIILSYSQKHDWRPPLVSKLLIYCGI